MPQEIIIPEKQRFVLQPYEDSPFGPDEIRGPTLATLVSQGTELGWAAGEDFPIRPGYSAVFRVEEIGAEVSGIAEGELRFCMGYHRQTQQHAARMTLPVPENIAPAEAVLARLMGVSMTTLMTTRARPGDRVVISGAGPVGLLAAQVFGLGGFEVSVVDPDPLRREQLAACGLRSVHASMPLDDPKLAGQVALVVDCSGHEAAVLEACQMVRRMGEVVLVGVPWRRLTEITAHELLNAVFFNLATLRSGWEWELPIHGRGFVWEELLEGYNNAPHSVLGGFQTALRWLSEGRIRHEGLMTKVSPEDPATLYADIAARRIAEPFIVYDWARLG